MKQLQGVAVECEGEAEAIEMMGLASQCLLFGTTNFENQLVVKYFKLIGEPQVSHQILVYCSVLVPHFALAAANFYRYKSREAKLDADALRSML
jgi:hypothetical protein